MLANNLVKLDRSSENDEENNNNVDDDNQADEAEVTASNEPEKSEASDGAANEAPVQEPIIVDLSDPDRTDTSENVKVEPQDVQNAEDTANVSGADEATDGDDKPKTKRRVSRARGLRRRTTPRKKSSDEENDEPQSA